MLPRMQRSFDAESQSEVIGGMATAIVSRDMYMKSIGAWHTNKAASRLLACGTMLYNQRIMIWAGG